MFGIDQGVNAIAGESFQASRDVSRDSRAFLTEMRHSPDLRLEVDPFQAINKSLQDCDDDAISAAVMRLPLAPTRI
jgi:hypothetical protein